MTVKEFKELFKGDIKFFDYATGEAIGEEFKTEKNEQLQELEIASLEIGTRANSIFAKVFVDIDTKTLKMREAIRTVAMSLYNTWCVRDNTKKENILYTNDKYIKDNGSSAYIANIKDLPTKILNSIVTEIRTYCDGHITFNIINEEEE
jgi:hypothetical protein